MKYQLAAPEDLGSVKALLHAMDQTFPVPLNQKADLDALAEKFLSRGLVYLALDGASPVGMLGFYANDLQTRTAYFSVLGVLASHQGQGIAKQLLLHALQLCKNIGMHTCVLYTHRTNTGAIALYKKLGFLAQDDPARPQDIQFVKKL